MGHLVLEHLRQTHHGHDGGGAGVVEARHEPRLRVGERPHEPVAEDGRVAGQQLRQPLLGKEDSGNYANFSAVTKPRSTFLRRNNKCTYPNET